MFRDAPGRLTPAQADSWRQQGAGSIEGYRGLVETRTPRPLKWGRRAVQLSEQGPPGSGLVDEGTDTVYVGSMAFMACGAKRYEMWTIFPQSGKISGKILNLGSIGKIIYTIQ